MTLVVAVRALANAKGHTIVIALWQSPAILTGFVVASAVWGLRSTQYVWEEAHHHKRAQVYRCCRGVHDRHETHDIA